MKDVRPELHGVAEEFARLVDTIRADEWDLPAMDQWSVRELVGHTLGGVKRAATYLDEPAEAVTHHSPAGYFLTVSAMAGIHDQVADRGRASAQLLGEDPVITVRRELEEAFVRIDGADLDAVVNVVGGGMVYGPYLFTRLLEVVMHTDDLARVLGRTVSIPESAVALVLGSLTDMLTADQGMAVARALTGREPLAPTNVFC